MIFDSLIALVFLYITRKCYGKLKAIRALLDQLRVITIYNVSEAIKHLSISKKKFAIIKGT